jgi:hypothetical protein
VGAFGLIFIPSTNKLRVEGEVPGLPGLRYAWNRDETELHLTYDSADGARRTFTAHLEDDVFRDERGKVIGRALPEGSVVIDPAAVSSDLIREDEPRLCPDRTPDKLSGKKGWAYLWFVAQIINPPNPTPYSYGYVLLRPDGTPVSFDDCHQTNGRMAEDKGPVYAKLLQFVWGRKSLTKQWLGQSARQLAALGWRELTWYFAEPRAAAFARRIFRNADEGREYIDIKVLKWEKKQ